MSDLSEPCGCDWTHVKGVVTWHMCERHRAVPAKTMLYEGDLFHALKDLVAATPVTPGSVPGFSRALDRAKALIRKIEGPR